MKREIEQAIAAVVKDLFNAAVDIELTRPDEQFGDYATNVALQLAGKLNKNPYEIAEVLREKLTSDEKFESVEVAGPGFLNLKLRDASLLEALKIKPQETLAGQTIVAEYSDPNPFKPLHAGHLYTTLVGDSIARLIEHAGAKTIRINYGGDVGLHVGKSMWAIIKYLGGENPEKLIEVSESERPDWMGARYVEGNSAYEDDEAAKAEVIEVNKRVYKLQADNDHDSPLAQIYWTCRQWSYGFFAALYERLQVVPFDRYIPESEVTPLDIKTVNEQLSKGVFKKSDGAVVFAGEEFDLHTRVFINSEGLPTYEAKDIGLGLTKWQDYHFDESVIITANEQAQYMQVVIAAIKQFEPEPAQRTKHLTHGVVKLAGGVKMSSRKGNVVNALDILDAAGKAARKLSDKPSAEMILAAVKYAFLKNRIGGDIIYNPEESVSLEGNSGPYLQYAHARARSILQKAEGDEQKITTALEPDERSLARKIAEYSEVIDKAVAELMPHHICTYLYELAQTFNRFYEHNHVIGNDRQSIRLKLVAKYANILKAGLELLGITAPEHM